MTKSSVELLKIVKMKEILGNFRSENVVSTKKKMPRPTPNTFQNSYDEVFSWIIKQNLSHLGEASAEWHKICINDNHNDWDITAIHMSMALHLNSRIAVKLVEFFKGTTIAASYCWPVNVVSRTSKKAPKPSEMKKNMLRLTSITSQYRYDEILSWIIKLQSR